MNTYTDAQMLYMLCLALDEGIEGIEHTEDLNVLLVKMIGEHWGMSDEETPIDQVDAAFEQLAPYIPAHLVET